MDRSILSGLTKTTFLVLICCCWIRLLESKASLNNNLISNSLSSSSSLRQKSDASSDSNVCHNFTIGNPSKGEFYSPRYPDEYPNNTECIAILQAPFGSQIKIEFRDQFSLEDSESCEYDRLEIRDGKFGYSDLIDKLCGHSFPHEITSKDNYLWLRFKSDESIEYSGFRAVYHFVPLPTTRPEPPSCYFERSGSSGTISHTEIPESVFQYYHMYNTPIECIWNITVQEGWQMYVNFNEYLLTRPNDCDVNYIDIYESVLSNEKRKYRFCGTTTEPQKSDGNIVNIRFHVREGIIEKNASKRLFKFDILFTAFRTNDKEKCKPSTEFDCDDGTCIDLKLKCNTDFNCKYRYDEDPNTTCFEGGKGIGILKSDQMILILMVFALLVVGMCTSIIVSCWGKIQERRQRELEYKLKRSRDTSLETGLDHPMIAQSYGGKCISTPDVMTMEGPMIAAGASASAEEYDEDDEGYDAEPPPQIISVNCPFYNQHIHNAHVVATARSQQDLYQRDRSDSEDMTIPPPPPPPALSHLRGPVMGHVGLG